MIDLDQLDADLAKLRVPVAPGDAMTSWDAAIRVVNAAPALVRAVRIARRNQAVAEAAAAIKVVH